MTGETLSALKMLAGFDDDTAKDARRTKNRRYSGLTQIHPALERVFTGETASCTLVLDFARPLRRGQRNWQPPAEDAYSTRRVTAPRRTLPPWLTQFSPPSPRKPSRHPALRRRNWSSRSWRRISKRFKHSATPLPDKSRRCLMTSLLAQGLDVDARRRHQDRLQHLAVHR